MSSNSSPYLIEPFDPVPDSPIVSASALGYIVPQQLASAERRPELGPAERRLESAVPAARRPRYAAPVRPAMRPPASATSRPPIFVVPVEVKTRELRFVKPIALPGVANLITLEGKQNYQAWSDQMAIVFKALGMYEVILEVAELLL